MTLTKAFEMTVEYLGETKDVKVDKEGYMCLNDMAQFFPNKNVKEWLTNRNTKDFIVVMEKFLTGGDSTLLKIEDFGSRGGIPKGLKAIKTKSGRYGGGTFAQKTLALKFAMWLSPEFELDVLLSYENGTQHKQDWNMQRILASENYKLQTESISLSPEGKLPYAKGYTSNAKLLNVLVFGEHQKGRRDTGTVVELNQISYLESKNSAFIDLGLSYEVRQVELAKLLVRKFGKNVKLLGENK
jgi:hypothetical protein